MSDKSLNNLEILDYYCKYDYLSPKEAVAVSFGVDPTKIEKFISSVEKALSHVGKKTLLDKSIVISTSIDELIDEINSRLENMCFIRGFNKELTGIIDKSIKNHTEKGVKVEVNSQEYHTLYDVFFEKCRHFIKEYTQRVNLLENAIDHYKILVHKSKIELIDFVRWCEQKNLSLPQELKELVKRYTLSYVDLEARCAKYELRIKELEAKNTDLEEQPKPLHGSKEKSYQKLIFLLVYQAYGLKEFDDKNVEDTLKDILMDAESLRDSTDQALPFELPDNKTITARYNDTINALFPQNKASLKNTKKTPKE